MATRTSKTQTPTIAAQPIRLPGKPELYLPVTTPAKATALGVKLFAQTGPDAHIPSWCIELPGSKEALVIGTWSQGASAANLFLAALGKLDGIDGIAGLSSFKRSGAMGTAGAFIALHLGKHASGDTIVKAAHVVASKAGRLGKGSCFCGEAHGTTVKAAKVAPKAKEEVSTEPEA